MAFTTRGALNRAERRVLRETTRENIDPQPDAQVTSLQDELDVSDVEWQQAYNTLQETLKKLEENNKTLEDFWSCEINYIVRLLMIEMINTIERKTDRSLENEMGYLQEGQIIKKPRMN